MFSACGRGIKHWRPEGRLWEPASQMPSLCNDLHLLVFTPMCSSLPLWAKVTCETSRILRVWNFLRYIVKDIAASSLVSWIAHFGEANHHVTTLQQLCVEKETQVEGIEASCQLCEWATLGMVPLASSFQMSAAQLIPDFLDLRTRPNSMEQSLHQNSDVSALHRDYPSLSSTSLTSWETRQPLTRLTRWLITQEL